MVECPHDLRDLYRQQRLIPFIGAGVSMSVEWEVHGEKRRGPSWKELVDQAAREIGAEDPDLLRTRGSDLQILEYFRLKNSGETAKLTNWLYANMTAPDDALKESEIHTALAEMDNCRIFYTTNYEDFLERALRLHGKDVAVIANENDMGVGAGVYQVVKFHGDLNSPSNMVLSESDYERRLKLADPLDYRLRSDILARALLFIGYSFRDWNVSYLFRLVNEQFRDLPRSPTGRRAYIVVSDPSRFEYELFRTRNIEVISVRQEYQTADTAELLRHICS